MGPDRIVRALSLFILVRDRIGCGVRHLEDYRGQFAAGESGELGAHLDVRR
jgi:hypothetical protein